MDKPTLGEMTEQYFALLARGKDLEEQMKKVEEEIDLLKQTILESCDEAGLSSVTSKSGSLKVSESVVPSVSNWDAYYEYIHENKYYHLLERRPSVTGCRELFEQGVRIPGAEPFVRRVLRSKKA